MIQERTCKDGLGVAGLAHYLGPCKKFGVFPKRKNRFEKPAGAVFGPAGALERFCPGPSFHTSCRVTTPHSQNPRASPSSLSSRGKSLLLNVPSDKDSPVSLCSKGVN